ncbi:hypothetical protein EMPG_14312 [Blastomyces silverae]|uniref:Uncharacterized protein n=1 Tax=Blastomyces silverae TaxID=2060906 RepID=A0A0H1BG52_9EURO|nr:hypothetical protein EMPG_14312 [Blastomyces silverae]
MLGRNQSPEASCVLNQTQLRPLSRLLMFSVPVNCPSSNSTLKILMEYNPEILRRMFDNSLVSNM